MQTILLQQHFPDFPLDELPSHPSGLFKTMMRDCSNLALCNSPAFCLEDKTNIWISVDRLHLADRYLGQASPRYQVFYEDEGIGFSQTVVVYQGDDFDVVLKTVMDLDTLTEEAGNQSFDDLVERWPSAFIQSGTYYT